MNEVGTTEGASNQAPAQEESKQAAQTDQADIDEKKRLANQKKKQKRKAKQ